MRLPKVRRAVVIFVDGLGAENLRQAAGHARFLNSFEANPIRCEFPSTTATSISGFATGTRSAEHGVIGYSVFLRGEQRFQNLLTGWESAEHATAFKKHPDLTETTPRGSVSVIGPEIYRDSGFTALTMSQSEYLAADSIADRFKVAKAQVSVGRGVSYLYIPELDQLAHRFGVESMQWRNALEEVDGLVAEFATGLPKDVGVILTADHGVIDVSNENHVLLDAHEWFTQSVRIVTGDPRCNFIYLNEDVDAQAFQSKLLDLVGVSAVVCTHSQLANTGWVMVEAEHSLSYQPDFYLIWQDSFVSYDRRTAKPHHLKLIGQHGAITDTEMRVPAIRFGAY